MIKGITIVVEFEDGTTVEEQLQHVTEFHEELVQPNMTTVGGGWRPAQRRYVLQGWKVTKADEQPPDPVEEVRVELVEMLKTKRAA